MPCNDFRFKENGMHMAEPYVEAGHYYAGIGYLSPDRQLSMSEILTQIDTAVNKLCDWATQQKSIK